MCHPRTHASSSSSYVSFYVCIILILLRILLRMHHHPSSSYVCILVRMHASSSSSYVSSYYVCIILVRMHPRTHACIILILLRILLRMHHPRTHASSYACILVRMHHPHPLTYPLTYASSSYECITLALSPGHTCLQIDFLDVCQGTHRVGDGAHVSEVCETTMGLRYR